jgi:Predicted membrane protein
MFYVIAFINIFSFILFWIDKRKAIKHQRRISEFTLLLITFLGGTVGALLGMVVFRHKISKRNFLIKFGFIVLIQAAFIYLYGKYS